MKATLGDRLLYSGLALMMLALAAVCAGGAWMAGSEFWPAAVLLGVMCCSALCLAGFGFYSAITGD